MPSDGARRLKLHKEAFGSMEIPGPGDSKWGILWRTSYLATITIREICGLIPIFSNK